MLQSTKSVISLHTSGDHRSQSLRFKVEQFEPIYSLKTQNDQESEIWIGQNLIMGLQSRLFGIRSDITFINAEKRRKDEKERGEKENKNSH